MNYMVANANKICPGLWLGDYYSANDEDFISSNNITLVVNCTTDLKFPQFYKHLHLTAIRIPLKDIKNDRANDNVLIRNIDDIEQRINDALCNGRNVLVHCYAGIQRSATVVAYYLMKRHTNYNFIKTIEYIEQCRPIAFTPTPTFKNFLRLLDRHYNSYHYKLFNGV